MTQTNNRPTAYTDAQRMELRSRVNLAGDVVARLWPMRTFISRNPLQGFEHLPFEEAVRQGEQLFGGRGYLSNKVYREAYHSGRIAQWQLDQALEPLVSRRSIVFGQRRFSHLEVLRAAVVHGLDAMCVGTSASAAGDGPGLDTTEITVLTQWLAKLDSETQNQDGHVRPSEPGEWTDQDTMAAWCDRTLGTDLEDRINRQLIKWCAAFCDEGEATWTMPGRDGTFFRAWKAAAQHDLGLALLGLNGASKNIRALPDAPDDALLESLGRLKVPSSLWESYLSCHVAALPGWAGFIKWRAEQTDYPWQEAYRIDLVNYLAVRLFYEREWVEAACRKILGCSGDLTAIHAYEQQFPHAIWVRRALLHGRLPKHAASEAARLGTWWRSPDALAWETLGQRWYSEHRLLSRQHVSADQARLLVQLATALNVPRELIASTAPSDVQTLMGWLRAVPEPQHGPIWLAAQELAHQHTLVQQLTAPLSHGGGQQGDDRIPVRPLAQFAFCIDVRSEVFRRHLEQRGGYDTYGFAGFFGLPVAYRALGADSSMDLCPVLLKAKHIIREVPRTYQGEAALRHKSSVRIVKAGHGLFQDLKHNVITPYVMVEAIGWFFAVPLLGKTLFPRAYHRLTARLQHQLIPTVATTLTVDKLPTTEAEEMVAGEQRMQIARWLRTRVQVSGGPLTADRLEDLRRQALGMDHEQTSAPGTLGRLLGLSTDEEQASLERLRVDCRITPRGTAARLNRITQTGFTLSEQAYYVETSLWRPPFGSWA